MPKSGRAAEEDNQKEGGDEMENKKTRSTIGVRNSTKARLDRSRAPGQCYDGFLRQLVDMWDKVHGNGKNLKSTS